MTKQIGWNPVSYCIKRSVDIVASLVLLVLLLPLFILISIIIAFDSGFPIIYAQDRLGKQFIPFRIYKFRTMHNEAEQDGPQLAREDDERVTSMGKFLRKWRIDELPQLYNVLIGNMSFVGPRPERKYFVDQLLNELDDYDLLFAVKPGITSSGMVHFGYASSIHEMKQRAPFDINYVQNLSLRQDIQVLFQTIQVLIEGSGK